MRTTHEQRAAMRTRLESDPTLGTHWEGCVVEHLGCAVLALLGDLEEAEELLGAVVADPGVWALVEFGKQATQVAGGAKNYVTSNMLDADGNVIAFLTIQAATGRNPAELRDEALADLATVTAERDALLARVRELEAPRARDCYCGNETQCRQAECVCACHLEARA